MNAPLPNLARQLGRWWLARHRHRLAARRDQATRLANICAEAHAATEAAARGSLPPKPDWLGVMGQGIKDRLQESVDQVPPPRPAKELDPVEIQLYLAGFIQRHKGQRLDLTGAYGAQSTDLTTAWVRLLSGRKGWTYPAPEARQLLDHAARLPGGWTLYLPISAPRPGDLAVFDGTPGAPFGWDGVVVSSALHDGNRTLLVFSQGPHPAQVVTVAPFAMGYLLGYLRPPTRAEA